MSAKRPIARGQKRRAATTAPRKPSGRTGNDRLVQGIFARTRSAGFERYIKNLLVELCQVDTTPNPNVQKMQAAEGECWRILERELGALPFTGARLERRPVNPAIQSHPHYSLLHFTKTAQRPKGLSAKETYANRSNLLYIVPGDGSGGTGQSVALNAHLDVVAPYFPPRVQGGIVYGRGACDDKGPAVSIVAALKVLSEAMAEAGLKWKRDIVTMLVVEEETGGNGSLSLAIDRDLKKLYDSILVCECTGLKFYPANRGAVWYRAEPANARGASHRLRCLPSSTSRWSKRAQPSAPRAGISSFPNGQCRPATALSAPSVSIPAGSAARSASISNSTVPRTRKLKRWCVIASKPVWPAISGFTAIRRKVTDPSTGKPMVARHYDLRRERKGFTVTVHGATGHMGAIRERDGAITKMAHLVRSLVLSKARLQSSPAARCDSNSGAKPAGDSLNLEGGQGFVPTHAITEVMDRLRRAAQIGADTYLRRVGRARAG